LIQHILVSENRQQSAEEGSSEDHEDNTGLLDLVLWAAVEGVSSSSDDEDEDDDEEEEAAASDGSE
jgi:DDB1- and CUL4-associated factor 8